LSTNANSPAANGAAEDLADGLIYPNSTGYSSRIHLSEAAERYLEQLGCDLMLGRCELHQLPPSLSQFWSFAFACGHRVGAASRDAEIENLEALADRLYFKAYNTPEQIREIYQRRLDGHFEREAARFFGEATA